MSEFTIDWPHGHQTRDGLNARIICSDKKSVNGYTIIALVDYGRGSEVVTCYTERGTFYHESGCTKDLINNPKPKKKGVLWVNVVEYADGKFVGRPYSSKAYADATDPWRVACVKVEWTEGDGLEEEKE